MEAEMGGKVPILKVDGGAARNDLLMQHQADVLGTPLLRGQITETTALGAAYLAGLATGFWTGRDEIRGLWKEDRRFEPSWTDSQRRDSISAWERAIKMTLS
jgi:glycerol kinase